MKTTTLTGSRIFDERYTNLGPGFKLSMPGATELTFHRRGAQATVVLSGRTVDRLPSIDWINTYGNVTANNGQYVMDAGAVLAATGILNRIEDERNTK